MKGAQEGSWTRDRVLRIVEETASEMFQALHRCTMGIPIAVSWLGVFLPVTTAPGMRGVQGLRRRFEAAVRGAVRAPSDWTGASLRQGQLLPSAPDVFDRLQRLRPTSLALVGAGAPWAVERFGCTPLDGVVGRHSHKYAWTFCLQVLFLFSTY